MLHLYKMGGKAKRVVDVGVASSEPMKPRVVKSAKRKAGPEALEQPPPLKAAPPLKDAPPLKAAPQAEYTGAAPPLKAGKVEKSEQWMTTQENIDAFFAKSNAKIPKAAAAARKAIADAQAFDQLNAGTLAEILGKKDYNNLCNNFRNTLVT